MSDLALTLATVGFILEFVGYAILAMYLLTDRKYTDLVYMAIAFLTCSATSWILFLIEAAIS